MIKKYIEITVTVEKIKQIPIEEVIYDGIEFFKLIGFISICDETDLSAGPKEAIDVYNDTVIKIDELAEKYGLHDYNKRYDDPWYELYTLWPKMEEFFKENIIL